MTFSLVFGASGSPRRRSLLLGLIALLELGFLAAVWVMLHRVHTESVDVQRDLQALKAELDVRTAQLESVPWSFAESPSGIRQVPGNQGVTRAQLEFLERYRGRLLADTDDVAKLKPAELMARLKAKLTADFSSDPENLENGGTPRQALVAFALLRTRGSIATYAVRPALKDDLRELVMGVRGNCSDFSLRLQMVLESIGVRAAMVSSKTRNLDGHVFVDAYDPDEDTAYLLDANFSVMIVQPHSGGQGFLARVLAMPEDKRRAYAKAVEIRAFPDYFRFVDPGEAGLTQTPVTDDSLNALVPGREAMWRRWLASDMPELQAWWKQVPAQAPHTLHEIAQFYLPSIPPVFNISGNLAGQLRTAAGMTRDIPGVSE